MNKFKRCRLLSRLWSSFKKRFGRKPSSRTIAISALVLFLLFLFGIENVRSREQYAPGALRVYAFSVGEANAALIELPDGRTILIDAATEEQGERLAFLLKKQGKIRLGMASASAGLVLAVICCIFITSGTGRGTLQQKEILMKKLAASQTAESAEENYND